MLQVDASKALQAPAEMLGPALASMLSAALVNRPQKHTSAAFPYMRLRVTCLPADFGCLTSIKRSVVEHAIDLGNIFLHVLFCQTDMSQLARRGRLLAVQTEE